MTKSVTRLAAALMVLCGCCHAMAEGVLDDFPDDGTWWKYGGRFSSGQIRGTHQAVLRAIGAKAIAGEPDARVFELEAVTQRFQSVLQLYVRNAPVQNLGLSVPDVLAGWYLADNQAAPVVVEPISGLQDYAQIPTVVIAVLHSISNDLASGDAEQIAAQLAAHWTPVEVTIADDEEFKVVGLEKPLVVRPIELTGSIFNTPFTLKVQWSDDVPFGLASVNLTADNEEKSQITLKLETTGKGRTSSTYPLITKKLAQIEEAGAEEADGELQRVLELLLSTIAITEPDVPDAAFAAIGDVLLTQPERSQELVAKLGVNASERLLPILLQRAGQGALSERILAAELYLQMGGSTTPQLEASVAQGLAARTQSLRLRAALLLAGGTAADIGPDVIKVLERDGLTQQRPEERVQVIAAIGRLGRDARDLLPAIIKTLGDDELAVRAAAMSAIGRVGPDDPRTKSMLLQSLSAEHTEIRQAAFSSLRDLSNLDDDALRSQISVLVESDDSALRADGITFLAEIDPSSPVLLEALDSPSSLVRVAAAQALAGNRQHANDTATIRRLCDLAVRDDYEDVRTAAQNTLVTYAQDRRRGILSALNGITNDDSLSGTQRVRAITIRRLIREN